MSNEKKPVVVGYGTSGEGDFALQWAARVAERRGVGLKVIHATGVEQPSVELARAGILEMYRKRAQEIAEEGARRARQMVSIPVEAVGVQRGPAAALEEASRSAGLVVIGHRGPNPLVAAVVGSTAFSVVTHAACPVAVIRQSPRPLPSMDYPIVVGVDGSEFSARALDGAAWLAADTQSFLRLVVAWQPPERSLWSSVFGSRRSTGGEPPADIAASADDDVFPTAWSGPAADARLYKQVAVDLAKRAESTAQWAIEHVRAHHPDLKIEHLVTEGAAADAILAAATDASLIAVGARGLGDLKSVLLGSVSRKVMQRAECAVYVIR